MIEAEVELIRESKRFWSFRIRYPSKDANRTCLHFGPIRYTKRKATREAAIEFLVYLFPKDEIHITVTELKVIKHQ